LDWTPLFITLRLALVTTVILVVVSIPIAHWLAFTKSKLKPFIETLVSMPLVLPPTVLGFYLLVAFSPSSAFGGWLETTFGLRLIFSFQGLVVASLIYSLPFMVHPLQSGFTQIPGSIIDASYVLGKSKLVTLQKVLLPNIQPAILTGIVLTFAHTIGEFGVVLMIGGNIPGQTKVASIAIYDEVESLNYAGANSYSLVLFSLAFVILLSVYLINGRGIKSLWK
tara:strand:+ start:115962 stop:116633 length:672 start_codon:yes stop_codon:yes gene_type:complete